MSLQDELKQTRPFPSLQEEAVIAIARTAAVLTHNGAEAIKPFGLTPTQYNALRILRGSEPNGLCRNEIRDRLITRVPDVTRLLDRLADMGLVVRGREDDDRRLVRTRITRKGLELIAPLDEILTRLHARQLARVPPDQLRTLVDTLAAARAGL